MRTALLFLMSFITIAASAQTVITGRITESNGSPIPGANVILAATYDGGSTDTTGGFRFISAEKGKFMLQISAIGFVKDSIEIELKGVEISIAIKLKQDISEMNLVTITAGTIETGDSKKGAVLSSLDVATTAGAVADVVAALQTLPGTAQAFGENGLFVRGGTGAETQTFFDGMMVKNAFGSQLPDQAGRSRFSPFLFNGTSFSTGGYSAQYGQALSSALLMETKDLPEKSSSEFSVMSVGLSGANTTKMKRSSLVVGANYYNLKPLYSVLNQNINWIKAPVEYQGSVQYKYKTSETGMLKIYTQFNQTDVGLRSGFGDDQVSTKISNSNRNYYFNSTYNEKIGKAWKLFAGVSMNVNDERGKVEENSYGFDNDFAQARLTLTRRFAGRHLIRTGVEASHSRYTESWNRQSRSFENNMQGLFAETELYLGNLFAARVGVRAENNSVLNILNVAPRISLAMKAGIHGQLAIAYGSFYQNPDDAYLVQKQDLDYEKADHYILNYQYRNDGITFRAEAYYKNYSNLTKYTLDGFVRNFGVTNFENLNNSGNGYSKGFDIFFRDKKTIRGGDYWISYSFLDTKRDFRNYPGKAVPPFAAKHSLNLVYKHFINALKTQVGVTYTYSSGRTYYNPNNSVFLSDKTKSFNNLSLNLSYITRLFNQFTVVYASATNLPGFKNIYGYNYSNDGRVKNPIYPAANRNLFVGILMTIGDNTFNH
ncbi:MAG: TonB-dependent receptor [Flavitalea sp.]